MSVKIRIKRGKLYLDIYQHRQRQWEALGLTVTEDKQQMKDIMKLAEICRSKREAQITSGEWGLLDPSRGKQSLSEYIKSINEKKKNANFYQTYTLLNKYNRGSISLSSITEKWLEDLQDFLLNDAGIAKGTAKLYESIVRQALKKATRDRLILRNPATAVKAIKAPSSDLIYLEFKEVQKLANTPIRGKTGIEIKKAFLFACYTGLRISDIKRLTWGDINREPLQIAKKQKKTENKVFIPLHETAWKIINDGAIHNYQSFIFPQLAKNKLNSYLSLQRWIKKAGIEKNVGWHTARRTFAMMTLESGAELETVSKLLDHADLKTTQIYARATDQMKRKAVNALPGIDI